MASTSTTQPCPHACSSRRRDLDDSDFSLKEWAAKARISRDNTNSRRFSSSSSYFREDTRSFRSNFTISSTASSPGYAFKDEIDPSTYSFTTALKALQARSSGCYQSWECSSSPPEGFALNSKWNEAEKYICNPLSGKVPLECLSAKTLSGRSFRYSANRITMSAPLVYSSSTSTHNFQSKPSSTNYTPQHVTLQFPISEKEKKKEGMTRDVGTQSTPPFLSSSSPSPASTPPIIERSIKRSGGESPISNSKTKSEEEEISCPSGNLDHLVVFGKAIKLINTSCVFEKGMSVFAINARELLLTHRKCLCSAEMLTLTCE
ncbi:mental retardation GTPase activating protein [Senna tora]|uniref:Mental retardation GTPase activating protein n=1 Tax=Senna tora TaxID=362788 RepID=A0A834TDZ2_9FABA|nr:mental retardation GTPase activating protein [Senna tora]